MRLLILRCHITNLRKLCALQIHTFQCFVFLIIIFIDLVHIVVLTDSCDIFSLF